MHENTFMHQKFSPYSRGWSLHTAPQGRVSDILPVFAGMVPKLSKDEASKTYSPRIRGDGPPGIAQQIVDVNILPVFAGMVRVGACWLWCRCYSPRIRGDGPR